jgi:hypothetical protein
VRLKNLPCLRGNGVGQTGIERGCFAKVPSHVSGDRGQNRGKGGTVHVVSGDGGREGGSGTRFVHSWRHLITLFKVGVTPSSKI